MIMMFYILILLIVKSCRSEVVDMNFSRCRSFFYKNSPPTGFSGNGLSSICQRYMTNDYHFATLYSTFHRIPIFSAYTLDTFYCTASQASRRSKWFIEPQLSGNTFPAQMSTEGTSADIYKQAQAINLDYPNTNYDRGHLNPSFYQCDDRRTATFTLTNAVPQDPCFNQQIWKQMEEMSKNIMMEKCNFPGARRFFVTGAVASYNRIPAYQRDEQGDQSRETNRVSVPSGMWTAACCDSTNSLNQNDRNKGFSFGYYGDNVPDSYVFPYLLSQLEEKLADNYGVTVNIFTDSCFSYSKNSEEAIQKLSLPVERKIAKALADMSKSSESSMNPDKTLFLKNFNNKLHFDENFNNQNWRLADADIGVRDLRGNAQSTRDKLAHYEMVPVQEAIQ